MWIITQYTLFKYILTNNYFILIIGTLLMKLVSKCCFICWLALYKVAMTNLVLAIYQNNTISTKNT